jgi:hypothetical protein
MNLSRRYRNLNEVYPLHLGEITTENYEITNIVLTEMDVKLARMRNYDSQWYVRGLQANFPYVRLVKKGEGIMMSDTPMERNTNYEFLVSANGDVLIFGLGLGLVVLPLLSDDGIKSITVVELYQDLIDVVQPILKAHDEKNKLTVIQGDAYNFDISKFNQKFDTIYFDIWIDICSDDYESHKTLKRKYRKLLNKNNPYYYMSAWLHDYYKKQVAKEKRESRIWESHFGNPFKNFSSTNEITL